MLVRCYITSPQQVINWLTTIQLLKGLVLTSDKCRHVKIMYVAHAAANCLLTCKSPPQCECVERAITRRYSELLWVIRFKMCSTLMIWFKEGHEGSYHKQFWKFHQEQSWEAHLQAINRPKVNHPRRPSAIWNTCQNSFFHLTQLEYAKYIVTSNTSKFWAVHTLEIHPNQSHLYSPFHLLISYILPSPSNALSNANLCLPCKMIPAHAVEASPQWDFPVKHLTTWVHWDS